MTRELEPCLNRFFGDDARRDLGSGWISGVLSVILGLLAICAVLVQCNRDGLFSEYEIEVGRISLLFQE